MYGKVRYGTVMLDKNGVDKLRSSFLCSCKYKYMYVWVRTRTYTYLRSFHYVRRAHFTTSWILRMT